jgi:predicted alpha/beta superfamily hydrolase
MRLLWATTWTNDKLTGDGGMTSRIVVALALLWVTGAWANESSVTGRLDIKTINAKVFPYPHGLRIWLPPGYDDPANAAKSYPVLYLLDGQNLFDRATSYSKIEWEVDETATRLIGEGKIPPLIIVGIDNAGVRRAEEYLTEDDPFNPDARETKGKLFPKFLIKDVMPYVKAHYRVAEGPDNTAIGGSSYGGIAALNFALNEPFLASRILIESPSLQVGNGGPLRETVNLARVSGRIYIGMGSQETGKPDIDQMHVAWANTLAENLASAAFPSAVHLTVGDGDRHHESAWARRLPEALVFLYGNDEGNVKSRLQAQK